MVDWTEAVHWFAGDMDEALIMLRAVRDEMYARDEHLSRVEWASRAGRWRHGRALSGMFMVSFLSAVRW